jgi:hypothetical protein
MDAIVLLSGMGMVLGKYVCHEGRAMLTVECDVSTAAVTTMA